MFRMENDKKLRNWLDRYDLDHPIVLAGPCSAETREQVLTIAHKLKNTDATVMRAGIWKPRTRPGQFEGVGEKGLKWLQQAREETGMLIATEVANASHVEIALRHDVDILWVGARSTVSPFIIQEIAEALKGTEKPVLVKNPMNPDLYLWLGAVERILSANVNNVGVIHRGFSVYNRTKYRNNPEWQIPIELQNQFPDLPLILDPSHIAGRRDIIFELCQEALDLNYDGFMIETHHDPDNAWSDASQQITPDTLAEITKELTIRKTTDHAQEFVNNLNKYRAQIDAVDQQIMKSMSERMMISDSIGQLKKSNNVAILQSKRWNKIIKKMTQEGKEKGLSKKFVSKVFKAIHIESIKHQEKIFKK